MKNEEILIYRRAGRNPAAKSLQSREFRPRIVPEFKLYNRNKQKRNWRYSED